MTENRILAALPRHAEGEPSAAPDRLTVAGMVERPLDLGLAELAALPQRTLRGDFKCLAGWEVPDLTWRGVALDDLLAAAGAAPGARWIQASGAGFSVPVPRDLAAGAIVALRLGDGPLAFEHGGPFRLLVTGGACYTSVKWLDRIELRERPGGNSASGRVRTGRPSR